MIKEIGFWLMMLHLTLWKKSILPWLIVTYPFRQLGLFRKTQQTDWVWEWTKVDNVQRSEWNKHWN